MFMTLGQVAIGGAIGASLRFLCGAWVIRLMPAGFGFPVAIIGVNVVGSFLMGMFVVWSHQKGMAELNPFVMVGLLGGFTTFSAFSLEAYTLFERGQIGAAGLYVALSVLLSLLGLMLGVMIARGLWA